MASDYKNGHRNIRSICPIVDIPDCHDTKIVENGLNELKVFINQGSVTELFGLDTYSLHYFEQDGCSLCGKRTLDVSPALHWLSVDNCAITIESTAGTDVEITLEISIDVTLDITTVEN